MIHYKEDEIQVQVQDQEQEQNQEQLIEIRYDNIVSNFEYEFYNIIEEYSKIIDIFSTINLYNICDHVTYNRYKIPRYIYTQIENMADDIMIQVSMVPKRTQKRLYEYDYIEYRLITHLNKYKIINNICKIISNYIIYN